VSNVYRLNHAYRNVTFSRSQIRSFCDGITFAYCVCKDSFSVALLVATSLCLTSGAQAQDQLDLEKDSLKFGFIKLTDCAPIVIAKEKGFFETEGLQVDVIAQPNWKTLLDNVITGELDGAHMLSGQPIAATIGFGTKAHVITAFTMDLNGNGITVSNAIWEGMQENEPALQSDTPPHPITAASLKPIVQEKLDGGEKLQMGMVFPNQAAVAKGIGVPVTTNFDIWKNNPEKVFGVTKSWADENPNTHLAVIKALIMAGKWLDATDESGNLTNREEAARILSRSDYVGADFDVIKNSMTGFFYFQKSDKRAMPDFNVFFKHYCTYPWYSDGVWFLTQMRRWGQITEPKPASWYDEMAKEVYKPEIYLKAARLLVEEGRVEESEIPWKTDGYKEPTSDFIDGLTYNGKKPLEYLKAHKIGNRE